MKDAVRMLAVLAIGFSVLTAAHFVVAEEEGDAVTNSETNSTTSDNTMVGGDIAQ